MKNMKKWLSLSLAGAMLMGVLAGCGGGTSSTPAPAETGAAEATGEPAAVEQVLKYGTDTWPAGFDPHTISAIAATRVFNQVYETLIDFNPDMTFKGVLAESWEIPDDVTYIFHIRQGVKFHNGREMTADDVVYSFQRVLGQTEYGDIGALGSSASYYGGIASIEANDDYTVTITLSEPNAAFMANLTSSYGAIVCREVVEANDGSNYTLPKEAGEYKRDNAYGDVYEGLDIPVEGGRVDNYGEAVRLMLPLIARSEQTIVRFQGDRQYDLTVSQADKDGILDILYGYAYMDRNR